MRAIFVKDIVLKFYEDIDIRDIFYKIEYNNFKYTSRFHESDDERKMDKMLAYLDVLGVLAKKKVIKVDDLEPLYYEISRIYCNKEVRQYLEFLEEWYRENDINRHPFKGMGYVVNKLKITCK